jgi:hypothetical protein
MHLSRSRASRAIISLAGALLAAAVFATAAFAGPTVTVRVEGEGSTLLPATTVTLGTPDPLNNCPADSAAAALNLATGGNWDHKPFVETILGETHAFAHSDTWAEWVDYKWGGGLCNDILQEGDELLIVADIEPPPTYAATVLPLVVSEVPAVVQAGTPFSVKASLVHLPTGEVPSGSGMPEPAEGITVSAGEAHATTGPGGVATLTLGSVGSVSLRATKSGDAPSRTFAICVHNGNDGNCGTVAPGAATLPFRASAPAPVPYKGPFALVAAVSGLLDGHTYSRAHAPRVLTGTILAHSAVTSVALSLRRTYHGRCSSYDGSRERFVAARCGQARFFDVSTSGVFSYLLPSALAPGRYVLDVRAADGAGNSMTLARGTSRIVFRVR